MDDWNVSEEGADLLIGRLEVLPGRMKEAALQGMYEFADNIVMPDSKANYCPFRFGYLSGSGVVYRDADKVYLEYGNPQAIGPEKGAHPNEYAVAQHENLEYKHPGGGGAKYLELPLIKYKDEIIAAAGQEVRNQLEIKGFLANETRTFSNIVLPNFTASFEAEVASGRPMESPRKPLGPPRLIKKPK